MRRWIDCGTYLTDVLDLLNGHHAHWAFYSFREDVWDGMDYELAPSVAPAQFYDLTAHGEAAMLQRSPHPLLDIIERHMAASLPNECTRMTRHDKWNARLRLKAVVLPAAIVFSSGCRPLCTAQRPQTNQERS